MNLLKDSSTKLFISKGFTALCNINLYFLNPIVGYMIFRMVHLKNQSKLCKHWRSPALTKIFEMRRSPHLGRNTPSVNSSPQPPTPNKLSVEEGSFNKSKCTQRTKRETFFSEPELKKLFQQDREILNPDFDQHFCLFACLMQKSTK